MYSRMYLKNGDVLDAEHIEHLEDGIVELEMKMPEPTQIDDTLTASGQAADAKTVGESLKTILERLKRIEYEPIKINSASVVPSIAEIGSIIDTVTINLVCNKEPESIKVNNVETAYTSGTSIVLNNLALDSNMNWSVAVADEEQSASTTLSLRFYNNIYYGSGVAADVSGAFTGLTKVLSDSKARTVTVNAGENKYIYYCVPTRLGTCSFNVGGFDGGFVKIGSTNHTNQSGYMESYDVYRSENSNLGQTTVVIK